MNSLLKTIIINTVKHSNVVLTRHPGIDEYIVKDNTGKTLMEYTNGWDYGQYVLTINGTKFEIEWYENTKKALSQKQQDMFDILHEITGRYTELERARNATMALTTAEQAIIDFLNGKTSVKAK